MPEIEILKHQPKTNKSVDLIKLFGQSLLYSSIQEPVSGVSQLVDKLTDSKILANVKIVSQPTPTKFGSSSWLAQTIGSGLGMIAPFVLLQGTTSRLLAKSSTVTDLLGSNLTNSVAIGATAKMTLDGAAYGFLFNPANQNQQDFWHQRLNSTLSTAVTFGAMGCVSEGINALTKISDTSVPNAFNNSGFKIASNAAGGSVGGFFNAESNSLLNDNQFASIKQIGQSMASFLVTGTALESVHLAIDHSKSLKDTIMNHFKGVKDNNESVKLPNLTDSQQALLDKVQKDHFQYFVQESDPVTGLTKDRSTADSLASIAATGFSLTAYPVATEHGWISRNEAANYTLKVLHTLTNTPQGDEARGDSGNHGFFYHFLDPKTGLRVNNNEVSTIDTALLMSGVLFAKDYFNQNNPAENEIRNLADNLYKRVDWNWAMDSDGRLSMGWTPEHGFIKADWQGYNEGGLALLLGLGSPTHELPAKAWDKYTSTDKIANLYGQKFIEFGPLFGHQYPQIWFDFKGIKDSLNQKLGFDYFENSRRAALVQHTYAEQNPQNWRGLNSLDWGLTASDGPGDLTKIINGKTIEFRGYNARGFPDEFNDGTIAPTAALGSLPFAPEIVMPTLEYWMKTRPEIYGNTGFKDAFNPTFDSTKPSGWVDPDTIGIDQGPILLMLENYRSGFIWDIMKKDPYFKTALKKAGFKPAK